MTKLGFVEQLTELPEFPSGSVEQKMCKKIAELTQVSLKSVTPDFDLFLSNRLLPVSRSGISYHKRKNISGPIC